MQIVQELCRRPGLNKCGFEMPTIYIPNPQKVRDGGSRLLCWLNVHGFPPRSDVSVDDLPMLHCCVRGNGFMCLCSIYIN